MVEKIISMVRNIQRSISTLSVCMVTFSLTIGLWSCATVPSAQESISFPAPRGEYGVGITDFKLVDEKRVDPFTGESSRSIMVKVWYPMDSKVVTGSQVALANWEQLGLARLIGMEPRDFSILHSSSLRDGAPSNKQLFPLVVYCHGGNGSVFTAMGILENIASHGYVVAAISHTGSSNFTIFPDGTSKGTMSAGDIIKILSTAKHDFKSQDQSYQVCGKIMDELVKDVTLTIDFLSVPLSGIKVPCDSSHIVIMGHSFGGGTAQECLFVPDQRIKGAINLDGMTWSARTLQGCPKPVLSIDSDLYWNWQQFWGSPEMEKTLSRYQYYYQCSREESLMLLKHEHSQVLSVEASQQGYSAAIKNSGHLSFGDHPTLAQAFPDIKEYREDRGSIMEEDFRQALDSLVFPFLDGLSQDGIPDFSESHPMVKMIVTPVKHQ